MSETPTEQVPVTEADREAAANYWRDFVAKLGECIVERAIRQGKMDEQESVQAFARHRQASQQWQDIASAPKDGSYIVVQLIDVSGAFEHLSGRCFVARHEGFLDSHDLGWALFPGMGGAPDRWIAAWKPLNLLSPPGDAQ